MAKPYGGSKGRQVGKTTPARKVTAPRPKAVNFGKIRARNGRLGAADGHTPIMST